jgi:hypothetical protein
VVCLIEEVLYLAIIVNNMLFHQLCVERIHGGLFSDGSKVKSGFSVSALPSYSHPGHPFISKLSPSTNLS